MKKSLLCILIFGLLQGCTEGEMPGVLDQEQPLAINVYCQNSPEHLIRRIEHSYENDRVTETAFINGDDIYSKKTFEYTSDGRLLMETEEADLRKSVKIYEYNPSNQLINIKHRFIEYDTDGHTTGESERDAPLAYKDDLLVKEWNYWGGFTAYEYENGQLVTMIEHKSNAAKHHITRYKYSGGLKIEERKETADAKLMYIHHFHYDIKNRLIRITERQNILEENTYDGNKLLEKRTYYFGIDPGYYPCYGNYIYTYEYQL